MLSASVAVTAAQGPVEVSVMVTEPAVTSAADGV